MKTGKVEASRRGPGHNAGTTISRKILASAAGSFKIEGLGLDLRSASEFRDLENGSVTASELRKKLLSRYSKTTTTS